MSMTMKRILSLVLCFVMLVGYVPAGVLTRAAETEISLAPVVEEAAVMEQVAAAEPAETNEVPVEAAAEEAAQEISYVTPEGFVDAALFFSDLHTSKSDYKETEILNVFGKAATDAAVPFSAVVSVGDAFSSNETSYKGDTSYITEDIRTALQDNTVPVYYAWSDHDRGADVTNYTGLVDIESDEYYLYFISMSDMSPAERYGVKSTFSEDKLTAFTETVAGLDHTKPLFIASHMPLHARRGDNGYADEWYGVISAAAEKMDVAFFWGHNHTSEKPVDQAAFYVAKDGDETLNVEGMSEPVKPNFTYLNAGYMRGKDSVRANAVTAVTITEDAIKYTVYGASGEIDGTYALDETVAREFAAEEENTVLYINVTEGDGAAYAVGETLRYKLSAAWSGGSETYVTQEDVAVSAVKTAEETAITLEEAMQTPGTYIATVVYEGKEVNFSFTVNAVEDDEEEETVTEELTLVIGGVEQTVEAKVATEDEAVVAALAPLGLKAFVAYDIKAELAEGETAEVSIPIPEDWNTENLTAYYITDEGELSDETFEGLYENGFFTFTVSHFSKYAVGDGSVEVDVDETNKDAVIPDNTTETTTKKTVYVQTNSISANKSYLIVNSNTAGNAYALANNNGSVDDTGVTIKTDSKIGTYIELDNASDELWAVSNSYQFKNGTSYLGYKGSSYNYSFDLSATARTWSYSNNKLSTDMGYYSYYLRYDSGWTWTYYESYGTSIYFYVPTEIDVETVTTIPGGTYSVTGEDVKLLTAANATANLSAPVTFTPNGGESVPVGNDKVTYKYEIVSDPEKAITSLDQTTGAVTFSGKVGKVLVKVTATGNHVNGGTATFECFDYLTIDASGPYYTVELVKPVFTYTEAPDDVTAEDVKNADAGTYFYESEGEYFAATGEDEEGMTYYTREITSLAAMEDTEHWKRAQGGDEHVFWAVVKEHTAEHPEGVDIGNVPNDQLVWEYNENYGMLDEATGTFIFSGVYGTFPVTVTYLNKDGIAQDSDTVVINARASTGLTSSDSPDDFPAYPKEGAVRIDKTASAVGSFSQTGIAKVELTMTGVPYSTGNAIDALLMLDMSTSMKTVVDNNGTPYNTSDDVDRYDVTGSATKAFVKTIVQNTDGTYNKNTVNIRYFNGNNTYGVTDGYITVSNDAELEAVYALIDELVNDPPTASGTYYSAAMKNAYDQTVARDAVSDNTQAVVFMSDGGPTYYTYLNDNGQGTTLGSTQSGGAASTFVSWFDVDNKGTTSKADDRATVNSKFETEYYSYLLKNAEPPYPVYTIGLGLANNSNGPTAFTSLGSKAHEDITSYILTSMATDSSYFYNIADDDAVANMGNIFAGIAESIKEAAKDVKVEDKIGKDYTVNFSLPTGVTSTEAAGMETFYIQAVEYALDPVTHERSGSYTVLENFSFNANTGALVSHTIKGVACDTSCGHVKIEEGKITKIDGTLFDYEVKADGEYMNWEAEKLTSSELALQYFVHLDGSTGENADSKSDGTYYTNEYAYVTYTNFNGKVCEQVFPVPQMTWNGAQVTYRFYLVNDQGQPVNRTGTVVPFPEAVWVTGPYTHSVTWNELTGTDKVFAQNILAEAQVPGVYQLYDQDAGYTVRVYQTETVDGTPGTNFNYFRISGTEPNGSKSSTTKVFNTLTGVRYDAYGIYSHKNVGTNVGEGTVNYKTDNIDYANTTVAFAVVWTPGLTQDAVVVDYGLDVVVNVAMNDITGTTVKGVRADKPAAAIDTGLYRNDDLKDTAQIMSSTVYKTYQLHAGEWVRTRSAYEGPSDAIVLPSPELPSTNGYEAGAEIAVYRSNIGVYQFYKLSDSQWKYVSETTTAPSSYYTELPDPTGTAGRTVVVRESWELGTATVESDYEVRFSQNQNMKFNEPAVVYYETQYTWLNENKEYQTDCMYSSLTVIPATNVYYEDTFFTSLVGFAPDENNADLSEHLQNVDRPGEALKNMPQGYDYDNVYGYDSSYDTSSQYSLDSVLKAVVDADSPAAAEFDFYGTGFDIISLTNNNSGTISVQVTNADTGAEVKYMMVDTFYGYKYETTYVNYTCEFTYTTYKAVNGKWTKSGETTVKPGSTAEVPSDCVTELPEKVTENTEIVVLEKKWVKGDQVEGEPTNFLYELPALNNVKQPTTVCLAEKEWQFDESSSDTLYQIPVIHVNDLPYDNYHVRIVCEYKDFLDHAAVGSYEMYLDAIRIYNPTGNLNEIANNAYIKDNEGWPVYQELRELLLDADATTNTAAKWDGAIFIDHQAGDATAPYTIEDYRNFGPNNELYLDVGQAVAFELKVPAKVRDVQIGMKSAAGDAVNAELTLMDATGNPISTSTGTITDSQSATDRYYSIGKNIGIDPKATNRQDITVVLKLQNKATEDADIGLLSITNIKFTFEPDVAEADRVINIGMNTALAANILARMNAPVVEEVEPEVVLKADLAVSVRNKNIKVGNNVILKATTSADVEYLTVNSQKITKFTEDKDTGKRTWSISVKAEEEGAMEVVVAACNGDRTLQTVVETVEVTAKKNGVVQQIVGQLIGMLTR